MVDAQITYLQEEARLGGYRLAQERHQEIADFYLAAAQLLNGRVHNIAWTGSATQSFGLAVSSIPWQPDDIVLTTRSDYVSNQLILLRLRDRFGIQLELLPDGETGFDTAALARRLEAGPRPRLLSITHLPTNSGRLQDIEAAGRLARRYDILYLVDACQSAGHIPLDVQQIGCDFLCATSRKYLRGPRGGGLLYVSDRVLASGLAPTTIDLRSADWTGPTTYRLRDDARRFESWERSPAIQLGTSLAIRHYLGQDAQQLYTRIRSLAHLAHQQLAAIDGVRMIDVPAGIDPPEWQPPSGLVFAALPCGDVSPVDFIARLAEQGVLAYYSTASADPYRYRELGVDWALRVSVHGFNEEEEVLEGVKTIGLLL